MSLTFTAASLPGRPAIGLASEPQLHVACTGVACYLGYLAHRYEETSEERVQRLLEKHNAPVASSYMNMSEGVWSEGV